MKPQKAWKRWLLSPKNRRLLGMLEGFSQGFFQVLDYSRNLYAASDSLKKIVGEENSAVSRSSSALEEISSMLTKTAASAQKLAEMANDTHASVKTGRSSLNEVVDGLKVIHEGTGQLKSSLQSNLDSLAQVVSVMSEIQSKTDLINDIVFQTKLLSFNASVEAARAGEFGKGFSVVAEEMSHLAVNSGKASQEISTILKKSLDTTQTLIGRMKNELTALMDQSSQNVQNGIKRGQEAEAAFDSIVRNVESVTNLSGEISSASSEQEIGVRDITAAIHQLHQLSNELTGISESTLKTALELSEKTEKQGSSLSAMGDVLGAEITPPQKPFDFDAAISAHIDWKMKLSRYLSNPDHSLDPQKVCLDNACALGKWLYGDGQNYESYAQYSSLRQAHAEFHKTAAEVITAIHSGKELEAKKILAPGGRYASKSDQCVGLIREMKSIAQDAGEDTLARAA